MSEYKLTFSSGVRITPASGIIESIGAIVPSGDNWNLVNSSFVQETSQFCWVWKKEPDTPVSIIESVTVIPDKPDPTINSRIYGFSINICDPCTWYVDSEYVSDAFIATASGGTSFSLPTDTNGELGIIDVQHGRITEENLLVAPTGGFTPVVTVSGITMAEREPFETSGGDYKIVYESGLLEFFEPQHGDVRATYYYSPSGVGPKFRGGPPAGKIWKIDGVEFQFTTDFKMDDTIIQNVSIVHPVYGFMFPYPDVEYKRLDNFTDFTYGSFPIIPKVGGERGIMEDTITLRWNYKTTLELKSSLSAQLESWSKHGRGFRGTRAVLAIYGLELDE